MRNLQNKFKVQKQISDAKQKDMAAAGEDALIKDEAVKDAEQRSVKLNVQDGGSVAGGDSRNLLSQLRVLRNALYENYAPQSI